MGSKKNPKIKNLQSETEFITWSHRSISLLASFGYAVKSSSKWEVNVYLNGEHVKKIYRRDIIVFLQTQGANIDYKEGEKTPKIFDNN
jgi:hypothetical protein